MSLEEVNTHQSDRQRLVALMQNRVFWPVIALILLMLFNAFYDASFFSLTIKNGHLFGSIVDILNRAAPIALIALGMTLVIATGGIDLSVGSVVAISGAVSAYLIANTALDVTGGIIAFSLLVAIIAGAWNGCLVAFLGIQPIIATLILMVAGRGIAQLITGGQILTFEHEGFEWLGGGFIFGLPTSIIVVAFIYCLTFFILKYTALGLFITSVGANPLASDYVGIREKRIKVFVYAFSGFCAGIAGLILTSDIQGADANNAGLWSELDAILAVVIGGTSLMGGRFYLGTTLIGVLILQTMTTTILTNGLPVQFTHVVKAAVVILVMLVMSPKFRAEVKALFPDGKGGKREY